MIRIIQEELNASTETFKGICEECNKSFLIAQRFKARAQKWKKCPKCNHKNYDLDFEIIDDTYLRMTYHRGGVNESYL